LTPWLPDLAASRNALQAAVGDLGVWGTRLAENLYRNRSDRRGTFAISLR
jgi:hypothetical protein